MSDTNETIAEVLRLDEEATPGPWDYWFEVGTRLGPDREHPIALVKQMRRASCPGGVRGAGVDADAALITYYRTAAPALAREVQRLQAEVCEARIGRDCAIVAAHESGRRAGQEDMRHRCASHVADNADGACNCGGTILCRPDCARVRLLDQVVAIRALEVE